MRLRLKESEGGVSGKDDSLGRLRVVRREEERGREGSAGMAAFVHNLLYRGFGLLVKVFLT